ncbi:MAG: hypothetical protein ACI4PO_02710 [Faecousia sp.]
MQVLKKDADLIEFRNTVKKCAGDVLFETGDGDSLNLKSVLSDFLFSMMSANQTYILSGHVVCQAESDYQIMDEFLEEG